MDRSTNGFSLLEITVVLLLIALAAGAVSPLLGNQISANQRKTTMTRMKALYRGMVGDPSLGDYGYLGDMGELPASLADLNTAGSQVTYVMDTDYGIGAGYNGPYAPTAGDILVDSWSTAFQYDPTSAQIISHGPDRTLGTSDDLLYPLQAPVVQGDLNVIVKGIPSGGGSEINLTSAEVDVYVARVSSGTRSEVAMGGSGPFLMQNLPVGYCGVRATGKGSYAGVTVRDVVEIGRGTRSRIIVLEEP